MSRSLDLVQLRSLVAIADCGGFGRAASALHVAQSTISQHVRLLEKRLGEPIVEREGRIAKFTPAGERLLLEARRILTVHDDALERLDAARTRPIVIGSTETAVNQVLPEVLRALRLAYPGRHVQFHIDRSTQMTESVARGTIDVALVLGFPGDTIGQQVGSVEMGWYAAPEWTAPADGEAWPLVAYFEPCGMRHRAMTVLSELGHEVEVAAESTTLEGVIAAARAGLGIAVLPSSRGTVPGLERRFDLPELGPIGVNVAVRRGVEPEIAEVAHRALSEFFETTG